MKKHALKEMPYTRYIRHVLEQAISLLVAVYQSTTTGKGLLAFILGAVTFSLAFYLAKRGVK